VKESLSLNREELPMAKQMKGDGVPSRKCECGMQMHLELDVGERRGGAVVPADSAAPAHPPLSFD